MMPRGGGGGGKTRPQRDDPRQPNLGMPNRPPEHTIMPPVMGNAPPGMNVGRPPMPDLNGETRGLGYGGQYNKGGYGGKMGETNRAANDLFAQFNAWQDPNISDGGASAGTLQRGYGGFEALSGRGNPNSMLGTKLNGFLNQYAGGGDRERAMNLLGYYNGGNPYVPQVSKGTNQFYRGNARENQQTGAMSAPGTYMHQSAGAYAAGPGEAPSMNFGGYIGSTTVGEDGSAQYTPWDVNARAGRTRRTGTTGARY